MGISSKWLQKDGKITVFPRAFRWTANCLKHPNLEAWFQYLKIDFLENRIYAKIYEDTAGDVYRWLTDKTAQDLVINHYDGCGDILFTYNFYGVRVQKDISNYDYSKSNILTHKVILSYISLTRK
jgi:hypothetical protein